MGEKPKLKLLLLPEMQRDSERKPVMSQLYLLAREVMTTAVTHLIMLKDETLGNIFFYICFF